MVLLAAIILGLAVGMVRGETLRRLGRLPLRGGIWVPFAFAIQWCIVYVHVPWCDGLWSTRTILLVFSYILLLAFVWLNRRLRGMWLIGLGLILNFAVIVANGGFMPITPEALIATGQENLAPGLQAGAHVRGTKDIVLPRTDTRLYWLSDIFILPPPFPLPSVFSLGDLLLAIGVFWLLQSAMMDTDTADR